jgi:filamentous hemagglutinin
MRKPHTLLYRLGNGLFLCVLAQWSGRSMAATALPVPCVANSCGANAKGFVTTGAATATQSGTTLSVTQTTSTATLNWSSFNIGAGGKVVFQQPSSSSIALNRIFDANPSSIFGTLTANGQIYLINANGFLFGSSAVVNVGGLLASSLNISDKTFAAGILTPGASGDPALTSTDNSGNVYTAGNIVVQAGAALTAADGGRLMLAAPNVTNGGTLTAPDGQVLLAAGQSLILTASDDENLRGLLVQVDGGGTAANMLSGSISAPRGNVTLAGLMVNQDGRVSATTSVNANGSIVLQAYDATSAGTVDLGPGSLTEVLPEYSDTTTAVTAQTQLQSSISIAGEKVFMQDATIDAPSGALNVVAAVNPALGVSSTDNPNAQIRIDSGTTIDLAGSDAELPMSANLVTVELRSNQLADDPTQRGGALQSTSTNTVTVTVDMRADGGKGTPIADVTSAIAAVGQTIAQRTEAGGTATFKSEGDVVMNSGASVNVSGGYTTYLGGTIQTTKLIGANGQLYDIGSANPLLTYTGVVNPTFTETYNKWGTQDVIATPGLSEYESTYVQGASAGTVQFAAPSMALAGALQATAVTGQYQRSSPPSGGTLIIGSSYSSGTYTDYLAPSVSLTASPTPVVVADGTPLPVETLQLPTSYLTADGFSTTQIYSNTSITLPAGLPLALTPGASLSLVAPRIDVDSSITAVDGTLNLDSLQTSVSPVPTVAGAATTERPGIGIGDGVTLDVSGQWTNDNLPAHGVGSAATLQNGGSINLQVTEQGSELVLGNNVSLKANGGAWLESGGTISYGKGGSITVDASPADAALQFGENLAVEGFGTGTASGGTFTLLAPRMDISQGSGDSWTTAQRVDDLTSTTGQVLQLYAPLFSDYGFSSVNLTATGAVESAATKDVLTVASGTTIDAQTSTLQLSGNYSSAVTGTSIAAFTTETLLPLYERPASSVSLNVLRKNDDIPLGNTNYGLLDVQAGASILADPGASISLAGEGGVVVAGTLRAPGGTIDISIPSPTAAAPQDTSNITDPGFQPTLGIDIAPSAVLDAGGTTVMTPNSQGLLSGTILPGGTVKLVADRGTVVVEAGSSIDVEGSSATLDVANAASVGGTTREMVASAGGSLTLSSPESISLLGSLHAAAGVGTSGSAAAGSLEVDLVQGVVSEIVSGTPYPSGTLEIELVNSTAGDTPSSSLSNTAVLGVQQLTESGIDSLTLRAGGSGTSPHSGTILIDSNQLTLARQLILDAPSITVEGNAVLSAPFVEIGNSEPYVGTNPVLSPYAGTGTLKVSAQQMVVLGNFAFDGASSVTLSSTGDVQLEGTTTSSTTGPTQGSILTSGSLAIDALRIYPDTYTDFSIASLKGSGGTVTLGSTGTSPGAPQSADGAVSISADNILVSGTVYAPFGSINLTANDSLTLASGSLVSVSGAGLDVPFGQTQLNEGEWIYTAGALTQITSVPTKQISLSAPNIAVQSGATANVSGGGNLYAYEWVPGTGGSADNLSATASSYANLYAIIPATKGQAGPYDPEESATSVAGQTIYLSGGAGIAAGYYTLLPARYALETGAVLIQLEPSYVSASSGQIGALANGMPVIAGYLSTGTTGLHTGGLTEYEGVAIYPSGYAEKLASYDISNASTYFSAIATSAGTGPVSEPADAGTFNISVTAAAINTLDLEGSVLSSAASGGRGAVVNVSAPDLEITSGSTASSSGALAVSATVLQSWDASSLTLGGTSSAVTETTGASTDSSGIAVAASTVTVDSGVQLSADQIVLVAQQSIDVQAGASLSSTSGKSGTVLTTLPAVNNITLTDAAGNALPQGALLAVSDLYLPVVARSASTGTTATTPSATISVEQGATLSSGGALAFDAPGDITLAGSLNGKGASWSLSSGSVAFVGSGTSTDTLNIDTNLLSSLQSAGAVRIASQGNIDIESSVSLGVSATGASPTLSSLTLIANSIDNQSGGNAVFGADTLILAGNTAVTSTSATPAAATAGAGNLSFVADSLTIGSGALSINGFAQTTAQVAGAVITQQSDGSANVAGYLNVGGNLTINAAEINPAADATDEPGTTIASTGTLTLGAPTAAAPGTTLPTLIGGGLTLSAGDIEDAGKIVALSGVVDLNSTGNLHLASTASIDASGATVEASGETAVSPGGLVALTAGGNLSLDAGSTVSVAGSASAPAGTLDVFASGGTVTLSGTLSGAAKGNVGGLTTGGSLTVDAGTLVGGLAGLVAVPGFAGFTDALNIRVRNGDLDLPNSTTVNANSITLTADNGTVDIAGTLTTDESAVGSVTPAAAQRGLIDLSGGTGVVLESTGQLHADASGGNGRGGEIDINSVTSSASCTYGTVCTSTGSIVLNLSSGASGSQISMLGSGTGQAGELVLRAPVSNAGDDVNISVNTASGGLGLGSAVGGQVVVEPVMVSLTTSSTADGDLANALGSASSFLSTYGQSIATRLGVSSTAVQAGVELRDYSPTDSLVFQQAVDLTQYSDAIDQSGNPNQVIDIAVRAAGSVTIDTDITDGMTAPGSGDTVLTGTTAGSSGSLSFVAGADLSGANPLSVLSASTSKASLTLAPEAVVATGTGSINLAAAGDVVFGYTKGVGATVFTTGYAAATPAANNQDLPINYATDGGNVTVAAGGNVVGAPLAVVDPAGGDFSVTGWQTRVTTRVSSTESVGSYGVNFDNFDWNMGALGGGDVTVTAGVKISNLSAATADSSPDGNATIYGAGGGLRLTAVGDIVSAQVYVADGVGTITTDSGLTASPQVTGGVAAGSSFALGDAQISVWARQSVQVDAVYNPTFTPQSSVQSGSATGFFTYGSDSALNISSTDGSVILNNLVSGNGAAGELLGLKVIEQSFQTFEDLPPSLTVQALQEDIDVNGAAALYPSSDGQLVLFAGRDINSTGSIVMSDNAVVPTAANTAAGGLKLTGQETGYLAPFQGAIHTVDSQPALITAGRDIIDLNLAIPKAAQIEAGRDIVQLTYQGQNLSASDTTLIAAGRDITYPTATGKISVGGPGSVDIFAGRNLDLGVSQGITTIGDLEDANLSTSAGADLTIAVGYGSQGADYASFLSTIIAPSTTYQSELVSYVEGQTGDTGLTYPQAQTVFTGFTHSQQTTFVDDVFFNELLLSGRAANSGTGVGFAEGYAAIDALFPYSRNPTTANPNPYAGSLDLIYSQIYTLSGGNISILVPGGSIDVGLAFTPTGVTKSAGQLGIVAEGSGNIDIYSQGDVNVNASRIFTLGGGNILIWSDEGSIDAGNGSKSSLSVPPPTVIVERQDGNVHARLQASLAGSGIRTIQTNPETCRRATWTWMRPWARSTPATRASVRPATSTLRRRTSSAP